MLQTFLKNIEKHWIWAALGLLTFQIMVLALMGRPWICPCGYVKLWNGSGITGDSSQHIADWYTYSHVIHGFVFYALLVALRPKWPVQYRMLVAMGIEIAWEFFENTQFVISHYRTTAAKDYNGDTILNSGFDTVWMLLGFAIAFKLPVKWTIGLLIGFELLAGWAVRDNLTLNILTFLWPIQAVIDWQIAG